MRPTFPPYLRAEETKRINRRVRQWRANENLYVLEIVGASCWDDLVDACRDAKVLDPPSRAGVRPVSLADSLFSGLAALPQRHIRVVVHAGDELLAESGMVALLWFAYTAIEVGHQLRTVRLAARRKSLQLYVGTPSGVAAKERQVHQDAST